MRRVLYVGLTVLCCCLIGKSSVNASDDFSENTRMWLVQEALDTVESGLQEVQAEDVSLYTANEEVYAEVKDCLDAAKGETPEQAVFLYLAESLEEYNKSVLTRKVSESFGTFLVNGLSESTAELAGSAVLSNLWNSYCTPTNMPENMPPEVCVILDYRDASWIVNFTANDQNILSRKVIAVSRPWSDAWREDLYQSEFASMFGALSELTVSYKEFRDYETIGTPDFMPCKEVPEGESFYRWAAEKMTSDTVLYCQNGKTLGLPEAVMEYAERWLDASADGCQRLLVWDKLSGRAAEILEGARMFSDHKSIPDGELYSTVLSAYAAQFGTEYLAFAGAANHSVVCRKPEGISGGHLLLAEYADGNGLFLSVVEMGEYVQVFSMPATWQDMQALEEYFGGCDYTLSVN